MGAGASIPETIPESEETALQAGFTQEQIDAYKASHATADPAPAEAAPAAAELEATPEEAAKAALAIQNQMRVKEAKAAVAEQRVVNSIGNDIATKVTVEVQKRLNSFEFTQMCQVRSTRWHEAAYGSSIEPPNRALDHAGFWRIFFFGLGLQTSGSFWEAVSGLGTRFYCLEKPPCFPHFVIYFLDTHKKQKEEFKKADANGDGALVVTELLPAMNAIKEREAPGPTIPLETADAVGFKHSSPLFSSKALAAKL